MTQQAGRMARQLPTLNGLRGIAAVTVFFSHTTLFGFFADERIDDWWYIALSRTGSAALGFFFILSGFVLTWSAPDHEPNRRFWRRRAARILPNHLVVVRRVHRPPDPGTRGRAAVADGGEPRAGAELDPE